MIQDTGSRRRHRLLLLALAAALVLAVPAALGRTVSFFFSDSITATDPTQAGRLARSDPPSTCGAAQSPTLADSVARHYDEYGPFQMGSSSIQCVTVTLDAMTCTGTQDLQSAVYYDPFSPDFPGSNYLGDIGLSPNPTKTYSVDMYPGNVFDVTVNEVNANAGCPAYSLTVSGGSLVFMAAMHSAAGSITNADPTQSGRLLDDDPAWMCNFSPPPADVVDSVPRHYDRYPFYNNAEIYECVTVKVDAPSCTGSNSLQSALYSPSFDPSNVASNLISDIGASPSPTKSYDAYVPPQTSFSVTVNELNANAGCSAYTLTVSGYGVGPTAATFGQFTAARAAKGITLRWWTGSELETLGYNLYRGQARERVRLNRRLIPAAGGGGSHIYTFVDRRAKRAPLYWLQEVRRSGTPIWRGPARMSG